LFVTRNFPLIIIYKKQSKQIKRGNDSPNNMQWLEKFLSNLTVRMTMYFMHVLLEREAVLGGDLRALWKRVDVDYHGMFVFLRFSYF
jgi:hypothetical protein